jgi:hypothetical protein
VNWGPGETVPKFTIATLSSAGSSTVDQQMGSPEVVFDVVGYFSPDCHSARRFQLRLEAAGMLDARHTAVQPQGALRPGGQSRGRWLTAPGQR